MLELRFICHFNNHTSAWTVSCDITIYGEQGPVTDKYTYYFPMVLDSEALEKAQTSLYELEKEKIEINKELAT